MTVRTNYVFIDYENVHVKSLLLLKKVQFRVKVFLGPNNTKLPVELVLAMQELGERGEYIVLETPGVNALDFHIAYYLGVLATADPLAFFHIISKDTGFDTLIKHLKAKKIYSARSASIEEMPCFVPPPTEGNGCNGSNVKGKQKDTIVKAPVEELVKIAVGDLVKRKASKPRTPKTLLSTIHATCGKNMPEAEIEAVYKKLVKLGYVQVSGTKVSYTLPTNQL